MKIIRLLWRFLYFAGYTFYIVMRIWLGKAFRREPMRAAMQIRQKWATRLLYGVGVRLRTDGEVPQTPCILAANHRSYLDPILMLCHVHAFPVAKAELANWPLIGKGAKMAGILYLNRDHSGSRVSTLKLMAQKLNEGFSIIIFPEGTTSALETCLPFKKGAFQIASRLNVPIVPVAICYADTRDYWVDEETFLVHAARRFRDDNIAVHVHYGPPITDADADVLLEKTRTWINAHL